MARRPRGRGGHPIATTTPTTTTANFTTGATAAIAADDDAAAAVVAARADAAALHDARDAVRVLCRVWPLRGPAGRAAAATTWWKCP